MIHSKKETLRETRSRSRSHNLRDRSPPENLKIKTMAKRSLNMTMKRKKPKKT